MPENTIHAIEIVFLLLLLFVVFFGALARKLKLPYPIVLVIAGLVLGFIPGTPHLSMSPDVVFLVFLPPLLYSAAWFTSWRDFKYNIVSILFLAFGLVGFTVAGVAIFAPHIFGGFDWRLGFVLGAVVATTDAIAATSIANRIGLPKRIVDILEGESLVNDASGLLALEFGVAMILSGQTPSVAVGFIRISYLIAIGIAVGILIGLIVERIERYLDDGPIEVTLSIMVPYIAYLAAERIHASGVLSVVACGLYLSRRSTRLFSPSVRLQAYGFWNALNFVLNGLVFVMIGLQLPFVLAGIREYRMSQLLLYGAIFSALLIALRVIWLYPGALFANIVRRRVFHQNERYPSRKSIFIVGWTGMRGVIALAAALSLPEMLSDGTPFPQRNLIIFLTFCVILVTLVLQGLTLAPLIRFLGLAGQSGPEEEEREARRIILEEALKHIKERREASESQNHHLAAAFDDALTKYKRRLSAVTGQSYEQHGIDAEDHAHIVDLGRQLVQIERETAVRLRNEGLISDQVLRQIEYELDLNETRLNPITQE
ncbi:MAG TPA: Na+/H+ antiporter [Candidatus Eisenbacteria bacterium]|jgi:CPA1 family monovalent cation:H+ antiporter|nr:Na+/H+ antiporter [Candidatus Eisenbacteria bacterium]